MKYMMSLVFFLVTSTPSYAQSGVAGAIHCDPAIVDQMQKVSELIRKESVCVSTLRTAIGNLISIKLIEPDPNLNGETLTRWTLNYEHTYVSVFANLSEPVPTLKFLTRKLHQF